MQITEIEGKGKGVVTTKPFQKNQVICEYKGKLLSHRLGIVKEQEYKKKKVGNYLFFFTSNGKQFW